MEGGLSFNWPLFFLVTLPFYFSLFSFPLHFLCPPAGLGPDPNILSLYVCFFFPKVLPDWLIRSGRAPLCCQMLAWSTALQDLALEGPGSVLRGGQSGCYCELTPVVTNPFLLFKSTWNLSLGHELVRRTWWKFIQKWKLCNFFSLSCHSNSLWLSAKIFKNNFCPCNESQWNAKKKVWFIHFWWSTLDIMLTQ